MAIFDAVVSIRRAKLPDPVSHPNVGSFFKNPLVSLAVADALQEKFPGLPVHADRKGLAKLSAAWLIDQAGLKGKRCGHFAVSSQHALVLENLGDGLAADLLQLVAEIRQQVLNIYSIALETEPAFYPVSSAVSE
jgi:UDP-N-acetylmuramate dehydrogenase